MTTAAARVTDAGKSRSTTSSILQPGRNCWRMDPAHRFYCIQDAADHFRLVRQALLNAQRTVFMLGWDIYAALDLLPGSDATDGPTRLQELLPFIVRRRRQLRCYILMWDYAALYTLERDPFSRWKLGWRMPRRIKFGFDDHHPVGGSHHQKVIVVDDQLAFCGGIDLTSHRWDTCAHRIDEPARKSAGKPYEPYHEVQAMVSGPAAASLGVLARDRWRAIGEKRMPRLAPSTSDLWPVDVTPDITDVGVAISRTVPEFATQPAVRECEALFLDSIAATKRSVYIESQYFTNDKLGDALARRLTEADGPEIIVVSPKECHGWLEQNTMGAFRDAVFRRLIAADTHGRLRIVYPAASQAQNVPTFIHSKVMVVDDELARIGSANFSRRSMGVDTECDLAVEAGGDPRVQAGVRQIRNRLVAEHLGLSVDAVESGIERSGSLRAFIDTRQRADRTLGRIELAAESEPPSEALRAAADPDEPILSGSLVADVAPPTDGTTRRGPFLVRIAVAIALTAALIAMSAVFIERPEFRALQDALNTMPSTSSTFWIGVGVFLLANLALLPLELMAIAAGVLFGALRGSGVALMGSLVAATAGYLAGRAIGRVGLPRWMSRRAYRSARQLGTQGVVGVLLLRLASIASAGSIHLLCGAVRVPFTTYIAGTVIGLAPAMFALAALGALLRQTLLFPSLSNALLTAVTAVLLIVVAALVRTFLLIRRFAPSVASHRARAEFG
jgi:phospholipase D1/2